MEYFDKYVFFIGLILTISVMAGAWSNRGSAPTLLVFLAIGMLFGEDGPGNIAFNNIPLSYLVCSIALAVILFDGGYNTSLRQFKLALKPALSLATLGVLITAFVLAGFLWLFGMPFLPALLIGTTVASTDAAAVFMVLAQQKIKLRQRIVSTLETESGLNDPMAIFLTISVVEIIIGQEKGGFFSFILFFIEQMGIGIAVGVVGGKLLSYVVKKIPIPNGLEPILGVSAALMIFGGAALMGGSGFMAAYISGIVLGHNIKKIKTEWGRFLDSMGWLSQIIMLLILGLLVTPSKMIDDFSIALISAIVLIFIARPLAVFASLHFSKFSRQEKIFISWVGLRGAVPIYLALIPALRGVEDSYTFFNVAFVIVLLSLIIQGWTIRPLAQYLGLYKGT